MVGTIVNIITVLIGSFIGIALKHKLSSKYTTVIFQAIGLFTVVLGIKIALSSNNLLLLILSLVIGTVLGEWINIQSLLDNTSNWLKSKLRISDDSFSEGLITSFLLFCVGSMTILGAIDEGLGKEPTLLYTKSVLDGISSIALAAAFGWGVALSVVPLFLYQGSLTLLAQQLQHVLNLEAITEISACGGVLIFGLGLSILNIVPIKTANLLPALAVNGILFYAFKAFGF